MARARSGTGWAIGALLLALAVPAVAEKPDYGSLWSLPCARAGAPPEEQANRIANMMAASDLVRVGFLVEKNGQGEWKFDPRKSNVLQEWCWDNGSLLQALDDAGARLQVVFLLHTQGEPNGYDYHRARGQGRVALLEKMPLGWYTESFVGYLGEHHPGMRIVGTNGKGVEYVSWCNECGYHPNDSRSDAEFLGKYFVAVDHAATQVPSQWQVIEGGLVGRLPVQPHQITSRGWWGSVHCNKKSDSQCRAALEECVDDYGQCVIDEDLKYRYEICLTTPGCKLYMPMYARMSGNPPESTCCWKVGGCSGDDARNGIGVCSCGGVYNDFGTEYGIVRRALRATRSAFGFAPPVGSFPNYRLFNEDAVRAGTATPGWDFGALLNTVEGPPPPPPVPPGYKQWKTLMRGWDAWHEEPEHAEALERRYRNWLERIGVEQ